MYASFWTVVNPTYEQFNNNNNEKREKTTQTMIVITLRYTRIIYMGLTPTCMNCVSCNGALFARRFCNTVLAIRARNCSRTWLDVLYTGTGWSSFEIENVNEFAVLYKSEKQQWEGEWWAQYLGETDELIRKKKKLHNS